MREWRGITQGYFIKARDWQMRNVTQSRGFMLFLEFVFLFPWLMLSGSCLCPDAGEQELTVSCTTLCFPSRGKYSESDHDCNHEIKPE